MSITFFFCPAVHLSTNVACGSHEQNPAFQLVQCNASDIGIELKSIQALCDTTTQRDATLGPVLYCEPGFTVS